MFFSESMQSGSSHPDVHTINLFAHLRPYECPNSLYVPTIDTAIFFSAMMEDMVQCKSLRERQRMPPFVRNPHV